MNKELFKKDSYKELSIKNCYNTLEFLINEGVDFAIVCYTNVIEFNPEIPESIAKFDENVLFIISGYTKESAILSKEYLQFEAGFGDSGFGSVLNIPLEAIFQIVLEDDILYLSNYKPKKRVVNSEELSLQNLLNNPENQKLLKKRVNKK